MGYNKETWWYFTFGAGQKFQGCYVKIYGNWGEARKKMVDKYGLQWAFQYSQDEWDEWVNIKPSYIPLEKELEVIA